MNIKKLIEYYLLKAFQNNISGPSAWSFLDKLNIPGFGTNLLRVFYPVNELSSPLWSPEKNPHLELNDFFNLNSDNYKKFIPYLKKNIDIILSWPNENNCNHKDVAQSSQFFSILDTLLLYSFIEHFKPKNFFEIGSGSTTKIAHKAKNDFNLAMKITSLDPNPRQDIDALCDNIIRHKLEDSWHTIPNHLSAGDMLFYDGSHYTFPGNDVVIFFLELITKLPKGVIVHIHDIYLPFDYPKSQLKQLWSEQYLLAAWLLGGSKQMEILFPSAFRIFQPEMNVIKSALNSDFESACSFWFKHV